MGRTPLHLACEKGHVAAAAALVAGGADLLAKDKVSHCDDCTI
jgi:ankyrin repeat protein